MLILSSVKETIAVKIGGSVLMDKKAASTRLREEVLRNIAGDVKELLERGYRVVLTHGVGTVGHMIVGKYGLHKGIDSDEKLLGLTEAQNRVNELVRAPLLRVFEETGVPVVMFYPSSCIVQERGRVKEFYDAPLRRFYERGFVPVMSGDMAADVDDKLYMSVCSADQLTLILAERLGASKAIFLVDGDGVYEGGNPEKTIPHLTISELRKVLEKVGGGAAIDVSGSMKGKLWEILLHGDFLRRGGEVWIINGLRPHSLLRALEGELERFTRITA